MNLRHAIVFMSGLAVVSDAVLIAFYPQFFERRYGVRDDLGVGLYIAGISLAVMCAFPLWARVEQRIDTLRLVNRTQFAAGSLCALSYWAPSPGAYVALTLPMFMCKASYLLLFPYLMRLQASDTHADTVGLLSVVVQLGAIVGTLAGASVMSHAGPAACLWLMAAGDFAQMAVCRWLIRSDLAPRSAPASERPPRGLRGVSTRLLSLCAVMLVVDFSGYLVRPFFSVWWEQVSTVHDEVVAGAVFAIPGAVALAALQIRRRLPPTGRFRFGTLQTNLLLGAAGLALQAVPQVGALLLGRALYGWAAFQTIVKLEVSVFKLGQAHNYALDYSVANFFQNLGVLLSACAAGALAQGFGPMPSFLLGAAGLLAAAMMNRRLLRLDAPTPKPEPSNAA